MLSKLKTIIKQKLISKYNLFILVHFILTIMILSSMNYLILIARKQYELESKTYQNAQVKEDIKKLKTQNNFYDTEYFKEIETKVQNYKKTDEIVLSTINLENPDEAFESYIPSSTLQKQDKFTLWINCFTKPSKECID